MKDIEAPVYFVSVCQNATYIKIEGRASYLNCQVLNDFLENMSKEGQTTFHFFFENCEGMDSTFLGILAGLALDVKKKNGECVLHGLTPKLKEIIFTIGLNNLLKIDYNSCINPGGKKINNALNSSNKSKGEQKSIILKAHDALSGVSKKNFFEFQCVVDFLNKKKN